MTRVRFPMLLLAAVVLSVSTMFAGGWAVVTLDELPERIEAGRALPLTFMVRQHGTRPLTGLSPSIEASTGTRKVSASAKAGAREGQYTASLTLPHPGEWSITIHSGFMTSKLTLLPLTVVDAASGVQASVSGAEKGRQLFVAKGCVTCHAHDVATPNHSLRLAPALIPQKYQDEFLARVLENPAATLPPSRTQFPGMPNYNLQPREVSALVAFINHGSNGRPQ
jgi:mono/diheme cytochrome c family protein